MQGELFEGVDPADLAVCLRVLSKLSRRLDRAEPAEPADAAA
jgi:hypothetical protein